MRRRYLGRLVASLLLAALAWVAYRQHEAAAQARRTLAAANQRQDHLELELADWNAKIAALEKDRLRLADSLAAEQYRSVSESNWDTLEERQRRIRIFRAGMAVRNAALYRALNLTPGQKSQFDKITDAYLQRVQDIAATVIAKGLPYPDPAVTELANENIAQYRQELLAALGAQTYNQFEEYRRTGAVRAIANGVAGDTYYSDAPLTAAQGDALTRILANASPSYQQGGETYMSAVDAPTALAQAQTILTPGQLASLKAQLLGMQAWSNLAPFVTPHPK